MYHDVMSEHHGGSITIQRIEALMRAKGMSLSDVARAGGIDKSTLSNILNGRRANPSSRSLEKIAAGLGTTLDYLRGHTNDPMPGDQTEPFPEFGLDVLEAMRRLPKSRNYELLVIARSFVEARQEIEQITLEEMKDFLLGVGNALEDEAEVDRLLRLLSAAEQNLTTRAGRRALPD